MPDINEFQFHDANVISFTAETIEDHFDRITLILESDKFVKKFESNKVKVVLSECFKATTKFNMWISGKDSIRTFRIIESSEWINELRNSSADGFGPDWNLMKHVRINLNISNSRIDILCKYISLSRVY